VQKSDGETTAAQREYEDHRLSQDERQDAGSQEPDVLLDVPVLKVEEITLTIEGLRAHVAVLAELADLVKLSVGADVELDKVELQIKGVEAQALLKVRLEQYGRSSTRPSPLSARILRSCRALCKRWIEL
jgi:hypothetical protein